MKQWNEFLNQIPRRAARVEANVQFIEGILEKISFSILVMTIKLMMPKIKLKGDKLKSFVWTNAKKQQNQ